MCRDDVLDLEASAVIAIHSLDLITEWVEGTPVSALAPEALGEVSRTAWELLVASLRIPWARSEFEQLCSDPPALREAAGLSISPSMGTPVIEEIPQRRPHVRRSRH